MIFKVTIGDNLVSRLVCPRFMREYSSDFMIVYVYYIMYPFSHPHAVLLTSKGLTSSTETDSCCGARDASVLGKFSVGS